MALSVFSRAVIDPVAVLDETQQQRAAALVVAHDVLPDGSAEELVSLAAYICDDLGGYVFMLNSTREKDEPDQVEIKDASGRTIYSGPVPEPDVFTIQPPGEPDLSWEEGRDA